MLGRGLAVGVALAAKLFVWPLVVWLLLTRRFRAAAWAVGSASVIVLGTWALVGFEGCATTRRCLRAVQDVYAVRSVSVSTVAGRSAPRCPSPSRVSAVAGLACLGSPRGSSGGPDGDRRAFAVLVAACILASPIVWPNYAALLFVPIAITWPRLAPAWFFGYADLACSACSHGPSARPGLLVVRQASPEMAWEAPDPTPLSRPPPARRSASSRPCWSGDGGTRRRARSTSG